MPEGAEANERGDQAARAPNADPLSIAEGKAFISYASQNAAIANALCNSMEDAGISCWLAPRDVRPGDFYADAIVQALATCRFLILVLSEAAIDSPHVMREIERASSKRLPVITFRIDTAPLTPGLEYFLSASQWLDASGGPAGRQFPALIAAVRGRAASAPNTESGARITAAAQPKQNRKTALVVVAVTFSAALTSLVAGKLWLSTHNDDHPSATTAIATPTPVTPSPVAAALFTPPPHSVAILPFVNMSGDAKQEYFSDGISEELLDALSRVNELQVMARTSSFSFKGQNVDISTIAHKLNVGAVLEGSVRRAGNTVRITVKLIDAVSGFQMWSQTYDRNLTDILKVQSDVATSVAKQLEVKLVGNETDKIELGGTRNSEAYDSYLHGTQLSTRRAGLEDEKAELAAYDRAISLDANYAAAYASRAMVLANIKNDTTDSHTRDQLLRQALTAAHRAVALAPDYGEAHLALGEILATALDFVGAAHELERALALAPGNAKVQRTFAWFAANSGHIEPALVAARRAVILDPQNYATHERLAMVLYLARRFDEAQSAFLHAQALNPVSHQLAGEMVWVLAVSGQIAQAQERCESSATPLDEDARRFCLALVYHAQGRKKDAEGELKQMQAIDGDSGAYVSALAYAQWGDRTAALEWLSKAEQLRDPMLGALKGEEWIFDPIRDDPQFKALEARLNFPP